MKYPVVSTEIFSYSTPKRVKHQTPEINSTIEMESEEDDSQTSSLLTHHMRRRSSHYAFGVGETLNILKQRVAEESSAPPAEKKPSLVHSVVILSSDDSDIENKEVTDIENNKVTQLGSKKQTKQTPKKNKLRNTPKKSKVRYFNIELNFILFGLILLLCRIISLCWHFQGA